MLADFSLTNLKLDWLSINLEMDLLVTRCLGE
jgi:hypothetical protein